jgi:hypothetical protein
MYGCSVIYENSYIVSRLRVLEDDSFATLLSDGGKATPETVRGMRGGVSVSVVIRCSRRRIWVTPAGEFLGQLTSVRQ